MGIAAERLVGSNPTHPDHNNKTGGGGIGKHGNVVTIVSE